jgi:peptidoglycan/xylan/chitin deacetylase (PgdA/CDA1 family)
MIRNVRPWVQVSDASSLTGWSIVSGSASVAPVPADAGPKFAGLNRVRVVSASNSASGISLAVNVPTGGKIKVHVYVATGHVSTGMLSCTLYAANNSNLTNRYNKFVRLNRGMNTLVMSRAVTSTNNAQENAWIVGNGTPNWASNIQVIRLDMDPAGSGTQSDWYVCGIEVDGYDRPAIMPTIDDGDASVASIARPILNACGLKATLYVISNAVGTAGYMTSSQLDQWAADGHAICCHTVNHWQNVLNQSNADLSVIRNQIVGCSDWLRARGYTRDNEHLHFASPFGEHVLNSAAPYRQVIRDTQLSAVTTITRMEAAEPGDWMALGRFTVDTFAQGTTLFDNLLDHAIGSGGMYLPLYHLFSAGAPATSLQVSQAQFEAQCKRYAQLVQGNVADNMTLPEYYRRMTQKG